MMGEFICASVLVHRMHKHLPVHAFNDSVICTSNGVESSELKQTEFI